MKKIFTTFALIVVFCMAAFSYEYVPVKTVTGHSYYYDNVVLSVYRNKKKDEAPYGQYFFKMTCPQLNEDLIIQTEDLKQALKLIKNMNYYLEIDCLIGDASGNIYEILGAFVPQVLAMAGSSSKGAAVSPAPVNLKIENQRFTGLASKDLIFGLLKESDDYKVQLKDKGLVYVTDYDTMYSFISDMDEVSSTFSRPEGKIDKFF